MHILLWWQASRNPPLPSTVSSRTPRADEPLHFREIASDNAVPFEFRNFGRREPEPAAVDLVIVLTDCRAGAGRDLVGAVEAQGSCWNDNLAQFGVVDPLEHAALVHMGV